MARVIRREFYDLSRSDMFRIVPIGDVHIGARGCNEKLLQETVNYVANNENTYWIGMGDYCDFINVRDPRFSFADLAPWITAAELVDLAAAQKERYVNIVKPIAGKCLGMIMGNHESAIQRHYERDIYSDIVNAVKKEAGMRPDDALGLGYYGWLTLHFYRNKTEKRTASTVTFNLHHGFTGGRLAGAKALNMQRWLWTHEADVVIFGHSHNIMAQPEAVEALDKGGNIISKVRRGCFSGSFLEGVNRDGPSSYAEVKGYLPLPIGGCEIMIDIGADDQRKRIRIIT